MRRFQYAALTLTICTAMAGASWSAAQETAAPATAPTDAAAKAQAVIDRGLAFLKSQQKPDGGWQGEKDPPAITALALRAFVQDPAYNHKTDFIQRGYQKLLSYQVGNGGIYQDVLANYNTAIAVGALTASEEPQYQANVQRAVEYLRSLQWTDALSGPKGEAIDEKSPWYGGFGYGGQSRGGGRPDLSNTQMTLEALHEAGLKPDDPAFKAAVRFVSRTQNLSETNDQPWSGNDGGFVYGPSLDSAGESFAGEYVGADGRRMLRSYGSMTYAGLKSFIYAGLTKDDPRVKAAWDWITRNWTLDENPGLRLGNPADAQRGLYYYYHTLARALNIYDQPLITDAQGKQHDWRLELIDKLAQLQRPDGSWTNEQDKWMEGNPVLVTSYCVLALQEVQRDLKEHPATP